MIKRYGDTNWKRLYIPDMPGIIPRRSRYGDHDTGFVPVEDQDSVELIGWNDLKEAIDQAHADRSMPMYHQNDSWGPVGFKWDQDGIGYCWTWSGAAAMMDCRATEAKDTVLLAPVSMGWLVGWKNQGNYLEDFIKGCRDKGMASAEFVDGNPNSHNRNPRTYKPGWEEDRAKYRLDEIWDTDTRRDSRTTILHCATILTQTSKPLYIAYNWWGHALELVGMLWDERQQNNIVWVIRNSHGEIEFIELTGSRGEPDEAYGFVSTKLVG